MEPEKDEKPLEHYRENFWNILQYLHKVDTKPWPKDYPTDPDHHLWAFSFAEEPFFVFGNAPAYKQRKTRDLGNSLVLGFQPRRIFEGLEGTTKGGVMSREKVRERVEKWDGLLPIQTSATMAIRNTVSGNNTSSVMTLSQLKGNALFIINNLAVSVQKLHK